MGYRIISLLTLLAIAITGCVGQSTVLQTPQPFQTLSRLQTSTPPSTIVDATQAPLRGNLEVFAAASLKDSFNEIGKRFETDHPGVKVTFNFAGSQLLAQQITSGAPVDVFASANQAQMDAAVKSGRIESTSIRNFVKNRLVVIYPSANPGKIKTLQDLSRPGLKIILADQSVPVGQYALSYLDHAAKDTSFGPAYKDAVLKNVVSYEQDVKAVLTKIQLGEADAGIVYTTDAATDKTGKIAQLAIPDTLNVIATYPITILKDSAQPQLAQAFVDFLGDVESQKIFVAYGFIPVGKNVQ